jgi:HPt (histidine-containing phosphotransfer) domain-containing protein
MARAPVVEDDVMLLPLGGPSAMDALERALDAAIEASPPALMATVRQRLARLGAEGGVEGRSFAARLLAAFVDQAPGTLAALETALADADDVALEAGAARLGAAAAHLGAGPLARLCADLEVRARTGSVPPVAAVRAALRRELTVTCRVMGALATELKQAVPRPAR